MKRSQAPSDYPAFLETLRERIQLARTRSIRATFHEGVLLYWDVGRAIVEKQRTAGWGDSVVERLAADLRASFPGRSGFSADNLWRARQLYLEYTSPDFLEQAVPEIERLGRPSLEQPVPETGARKKPPANRRRGLHVELPAQETAVRDLVAAIPWGHHVELLKRVKGPAERIYYNEKERAPDDAPSTGIILCAEKDDVEVEFALKTKNNPIGVAEYQLQPTLPARLKDRLPSARQLAAVVREALPPRT